MVTFVLPVCPAIGVRVKVRSTPLPAKLMLALGSNALFEEVPVIVNELSAVSASHTPNQVGDVGVPIEPARFCSDVMNGARLVIVSAGRRPVSAFSRAP